MKNLPCFLFAAIIAIAVSRTAQGIEYPDGYQVCTFNKPAVMKNCGKKIVVLYALDPRTKHWVWVWHKDTIWLADYLTFPVARSSPNFSDNVHYGEELQVLLPITIAFCGFKNGPVCVEFTEPTAKHRTLKDLPGKPRD